MRSSHHHWATLAHRRTNRFGGALVGAVAASFGGGINGYTTAFLAVAIVLIVMVTLTLGLKGQVAERAAAKQNHAATETAQA